ncbi:peroxidase 29-like isoform X1 [Actinidia eriantha]|uniref:peroxidase 29-like isoform X1 n=2 Tax=Actinidia eriantha TaxID=165200 RepID=UPI0025879EB5|nr:peroxidase 29-like isoform X1 [Actinidia eriantha]
MDLRSIFGVMFVVVLWLDQVEGGRLSYDFYDRTCPQVEEIVRAGLQSISLYDPSSPAALLRLMFHDCQVQGCDASILIDPNDFAIPSEMGSQKNFGIRKRESISILKSMVEAVCPHQVSCADILILAAREAVAISGGPRIRVPLGRRDSGSLPSYELANALLPPANLGVEGMLGLFAKKGMSIEESVAIMGAHTLGITHCFNFFGRTNIEAGLEMMLRLCCPIGSLTPNTSFVLNDPTAFIFDNNYYINAVNGRGILVVDAELPLHPRTAPFVQLFAADQEGFFRAFTSAFVKLSSYGVLTGAEGVIRTSCNII